VLHEFNSTLKFKLFIEFEEINFKNAQSGRGPPQGSFSPSKCVISSRRNVFARALLSPQDDRDRLVTFVVRVHQDFCEPHDHPLDVQRVVLSSTRSLM
jgi:hypothetical protein